MRRLVSALCKLATLGFVNAAMVFLVCCQKRNFNYGEAKHQVGHPTLDGSAFSWRETSLEDFRKGNFFFIPHEDFVSGRKSELFQIVNDWLSRTHDTMRRAFPKELANIPRPFAAIVAYPQVNASVLVDAYCWDADVTFAGEKADSNAESEVLGLKDGVIDTTSSGTRCVDPGVSEIPPMEYFKWLSARMSPCTISYDAAKKAIELGKGCRSNVPRTTSSRSFHTPVMLNAIVINTQSISNFQTFEHFAAIISHELAHYYRAHGVIAAHEFNFFYNVKAAPKTTRPVPSDDPRVKAIESKLKTMSFPAFVIERLSGIEREIPALLMWSKALTSDAARMELSKEESCRSPLSNASSVSTVLERYVGPQDCCTARELSQLSAFAGEVMACGKSIPLVRKIGGVPARDVFRSGLRASRIALDEAFDDPRDLTASDLTLRLESTLRGQKAKVDAVVREGLAANAGFYTIEQEADEMGAEILALMGYQPSVHMIPAWFGFLGKGSSKTKFDPLDGFVRKCEAALAADWKAPPGSDAALFIPFFGPLRRLHHADCYRIYNIDQELKAHTYKPNPTPLTLSRPWTDVQRLARAFQTETIAKHGDPSAFD